MGFEASTILWMPEQEPPLTKDELLLWRQQCVWTQEEASRWLRVPTSTYRNWEMGLHKPAPSRTRTLRQQMAKAPLIKLPTSVVGAGSVVYFVRYGHDGPIKIGYSATPRVRLAEICSIQMPEPLIPMGAMPGSQADEVSLHRKFAALRLRGEWFRPAPELLEYIAQVTALPTPKPRPKKKIDHPELDL